MNGPASRSKQAEDLREFATVSTPHDRASDSAGLGLAFCELAVEAHGGVIGVDAGQSGGSVFWFELPNLL
jgi:K+-sensing histidine kinase KdpD